MMPQEGRKVVWVMSRLCVVCKMSVGCAMQCRLQEDNDSWVKQRKTRYSRMDYGYFTSKRDSRL